MALLSKRKLFVFFLEVTLFSSLTYSQTTQTVTDNATNATTDNGTLTTQAPAATTAAASGTTPVMTAGATDPPPGVGEGETPIEPNTGWKSY